MVTFARAAALAPLLLLSTACKQKSPEALSPDAGPFERSRLWDYPDEPWDASDMQKEARLQFVWAAPDEKTPSIFSMKLDGTDIRRVIGPERLFTGDAKYLQQTPVRSPNRRFVACIGDDAQGNEVRFLVDLQERSVRTLMKATNPTGLTWTPDSRRILFYGDDRLWQYDLETRALSPQPTNIGPYGLHLVDGGRRLLALREGAVEVRDLDGKLLKRIDVPYRTAAQHAISADGRFIAVQQVPFVIIDLDHPAKPVFSSPDTFFSPTFGPDGGTLFFFTGYLNALDVASGAVRKLARLPSPWTASAATTLPPVVHG